MNVKYENNNSFTSCFFEDIKEGEVFKYKDAVYMRIFPVEMSMSTYRAVNISTGVIRAIKDSAEVTLLHGEYIVKF